MSDTTNPIPPPESSPPKPITINDLWSAMFDSLGDGPPTPEKRKRLDDTLKQYLLEQISQHPDASKYNLLVFHDEGSMVKSDADRIYSAVSRISEKKPLLLTLYSTGGSIGSAYLIGKLCREYSNGKLVVVVPRQAKSAATLLCCAADEIHMGSLSELGPIDPQIDGMPALGLKQAVEHIAELVKERPESAEMFAKYLNASLKLINLGYYERVAESAAQYALKLLQTHATVLGNSPDKISTDLVYTYKDHGFVIDKSEATSIFGTKVIKTNTPEYDLGNLIYQKMVLIGRWARIVEHDFYFIGAPDDKGVFTKQK